MDTTWPWISLTLFAACMFLYVLSPFVALVKLGPQELLNHLGAVTALGEVVTMGLIPIAVVVALRGPLRRELHLRRPRAGLLIVLIPIVIVWPVTTQLMSQYLGTYFPPDAGHNALFEKLLTWHTPGQAAIVILQIALVPAVCEELLFRGLFLSGLRRLIGDWPAVIIVGTVFASIHVVPLVITAPGAAVGMMIPLTILGLCLTILTVRTGTLIYASILHFANNLLALVMANHASDAFVETWMSDGVALAVLTPIALVLLVAWLRLARRYPDPIRAASASERVLCFRSA
jgi:membrane protease YdiL (CAAX protease family)